jgi:hypothetical protein
MDCRGPLANSSLCDPFSTMAPSFTTTIRSAKRPVAHLCEVTRDAAPVFRSVAIRFASSTSDMCTVTSSKSSSEPMRDRSILTPDAAGLSLSRIVWVKTRAKSTLDHSAGESALHRGRSGEGLNSSSLAVTTVASLDDKRGIKVAESPVI